MRWFNHDGFVLKRREVNVGDAGTPGAQLAVIGRNRIGELPTRRGSRKRPPYGTKDEATRVIPVLDQVGPLESDSDQRKERLRLSLGRGANRDLDRTRETRRQGEMPLTKLIDGAVLMAKRAELQVVHCVLTDQLHKARARSLGLDDDLQRYIPPNILEHIHKQHHQQQRKQAVADLMKQTNGEFWSSWLAATQAGTRLT